MSDAVRGWDSNFNVFSGESLQKILSSLLMAVPVPGESQARAWRESIPKLQTEVRELVQGDPSTAAYTAVLEYQLPLEFRRADAVFLMHDAIVVLELKGKRDPSQADLDQAQAYARDLKAYHGECADRSLHAILVPTLAKDEYRLEGNVHVCSPGRLDWLISQLDVRRDGTPVCASAFLSQEAYRPLPTLVRAARELFTTGELKRVKRAAAATENATAKLSQLVRDAANGRRRKLALVTGVPGAGKTLVGLRLVHSHEIDTFSIARGKEKPTAPAVFLSGNGPLVEVLSYELRDAGGNGRTFVRGVKQYVDRYLSNTKLIPNEHVIVYDEAQRAYDAQMVAAKHKKEIGAAKSEPELFIEFAERIPEWCLVVALIGTGQEIHKGEEAGIGQWAAAIKQSALRSNWEVYGPDLLRSAFTGLAFKSESELSLDNSLRSHLASELHRFVAQVVEFDDAELSLAVSGVQEDRARYAVPGKTVAIAALAAQLAMQGHHLRLTRDLEAAKTYLRERYAGDAMARFGVLASSRDRALPEFGISNDFQSTKRTKFGPWYGDGEGDPGALSCRHLTDCVTEFGAQGLELDGALLAWGTDFVRSHWQWSIANASKYKKGGSVVKDAKRLRANAYRVLLTRARDGTVVYVPDIPEMDETHAFLQACGFGPI
jgi:hypothetical protein